MYNFADSTVTASAFTAGANTGLTLVASTAGLTTTAALVIYYDDQVAGISGTVTANLNLPSFAGGNGDTLTSAVQIGYYDANSGEFRKVDSQYNPLPISGTVVLGAALPVGTNRIGTVTVGNTVSFISVASDDELTANISSAIINSPLPAGTNRIGVVTIGGGTVTIGAGTAQIGSVTASLAISSTAITSGVFSSLTSATLVPGNVARKMATVYNLGPGQLFVNAGASATTLGGGFMVALSSSDYLECDYTTTTLSALFATAGTASWVSH